jgi:hypothetical protein
MIIIFSKEFITMPKMLFQNLVLFFEAKPTFLLGSE